MPDREKVIKGLGIVSRMLNEMGRRNEMDIVDDALALLKEQKWIPVTERLPKSMANKVIVYIQHEDLVPYIGYGHYENYHGRSTWYNLENNEEFSERGYKVTHWMPMPKSPEGR